MSWFIVVLLAATRPPDMNLSPSDRARVIEATAATIERMYVDEAKAVEIAAALRAAKFDDIQSALALVPAVNKVIRAASNDQHLRFGYSHEPATKPDGAPDTAEERAQWIREAAENGFGIDGVQRLEGNVGLLTWMKFYEPEIAGDAVAAAMRLLASTDALIIDLRNSEGGAPEMVQLLMTYCMPAGDPVHISTIENRAEHRTRQFWTLPYVSGPRYTNAIYILTSAKTWSAGEGFTEHMKRFKRATIVGETTRGGARLGRFVTVHPNFAVFVSLWRQTDPVVDWEAKGVAPDVAVDAAQALETAHRLALEKLGKAR